jgi:uncharacterized membrane protein
VLLLTVLLFAYFDLIRVGLDDHESIETGNDQGGKMKNIRFISACLVGGIVFLLVLVLNRFEWGRRLNGWALKI